MPVTLAWIVGYCSSRKFARFSRFARDGFHLTNPSILAVDEEEQPGHANGLPRSFERRDGGSEAIEDGFAVLNGPIFADGLPNEGGIFHRGLRPVGPQPPPSPCIVRGFGAVASSFRPFSFPPGECHTTILPWTRKESQWYYPVVPCRCPCCNCCSKDPKAGGCVHPLPPSSLSKPGGIRSSSIWGFDGG